MSQDLQAFLRSRKHLGELRWGPGLALSLGLHLALGAAFFWPRTEPPDKEAEVKVTWVNQETIEHVIWEKMTWLDKYVKNAGTKN